MHFENQRANASQLMDSNSWIIPDYGLEKFLRGTGGYADEQALLQNFYILSHLQTLLIILKS